MAKKPKTTVESVEGGCTQAQCAADIGCSVRTIAELVAKGVVPDPKTLTVSQWRLAYVRYLRDVAGGRKSKEGYDLVGERARLAREQADAQELKNAITRGEYVRGGDVDEYMVRLVGAFVQRLRAIPPKAAPEIRITATDAEAEALLQTFLDEALTEIASAARDAADRLARRAAGETVAVVRMSRTGDDAAAEAIDESVGGSAEEAEPGIERGTGTVEDE